MEIACFCKHVTTHGIYKKKKIYLSEFLTLSNGLDVMLDMSGPFDYSLAILLLLFYDSDAFQVKSQKPWKLSLICYIPKSEEWTTIHK